MTMTAEARCAAHPERVARGTCKRCGDFVCADCDVSGFETGGSLCTRCAETRAESRYHVVPPGRFILMSVLSLNLYIVYWFWKNWVAVKRSEGSDIWPIPRALFSGITYFMLLTDINTQLHLRGSQRRLSSMLGIGFLLFTATWRLPDPYWLVSSFSAIFLLPAVFAIKELASQAALRSAGWRVRHTVAVIAGTMFLTLAVIGTFLPEED